MEKDHKIEVRLTGREYRAVQRFAKAENRTVSDLVRARVVTAALTHDPRQTALQLRERDAPP